MLIVKYLNNYNDNVNCSTKTNSKEHQKNFIVFTSLNFLVKQNRLPTCLPNIISFYMIRPNPTVS